jgi:hypothetical protein
MSVKLEGESESASRPPIERALDARDSSGGGACSGRGVEQATAPSGFVCCGW